MKLRAQGFEVEEEEPELRRWMQSKGCKGLELVRLRTDGRLGVWLRSEKVESGREILVVPRDCCISVSEPEDGSDQDIEEALAWQLLQERWKGQNSQYAPYVEFLWRQDQSQHPLFWGQEELGWLSVCPAAQSAVLNAQDKMERRARKLEARACAVRSDAAQRESLSTEVRFALVLVECRAIGVEGILESDPGMAALVPVMDHFRHNPNDAQSILVGESESEPGGPMVAQSAQEQMPGSELRSCFGYASNVELFCQYGLVPTLGDDSEEQQFVELESNFFGMVELPVRVSQKTWKETPDQNIRRLKTQLLAERAGLNFSAGEDAVLRLPGDGAVVGRMMPTARFLVSPVFTEEDCEELFARLFADCNRSFLPEDAGQLGTPEVASPAPVNNADELRLEIQAREIAVEWCDNSLKRYVKMIERLSDVFGETKGVAANPLQQVTDVESKTEVGEVTRAHFNAKNKDETTGKSRKAKECRVLSYSGSGVVTVQFLENGVRQSIPENWLVESTQATDSNSSGLKAHELGERRARALLALALISGERQVIEDISDMLKSVLELGQGLLDPKKSDSEKTILAQKLQAAWQAEQAQKLQAQKLQDKQIQEEQQLAKQEADVLAAKGTKQQEKHVPELA